MIDTVYCTMGRYSINNKTMGWTNVPSKLYTYARAHWSWGTQENLKRT